jgi:multisubunit Na+/H+ antiporter MnhE subunit
VWGFGWLLAAAGYLLLIDNTDLPELLVGAGAATIAAAGFALGREQYLIAETIRGHWLLRAWRPVANVPVDIASVSVVALRVLRHPRSIPQGGFRAIRFRCGEDEALEVGRRALAQWLGSFAPNTIVVGVDPDRELILAHQLSRRGGEQAIDVMGLG